MKKVLVILLAFFSIVALAIRFGAGPLMAYLETNQRAGLRVEANKKSNVFINDKLVGETPYQDENLKEGEITVGLKPIEASNSGLLVGNNSEHDASGSGQTEGGNYAWQGYVQLNNGTLSVVNRELGGDVEVTSSGEVITLKKGDGVTVVSSPAEASVEVDGKPSGRTPATIRGLAPGEHQFVLSKDTYLKRSIRVTLVEDYALTLAVDLAISEVDLSKAVTIPVSSATTVVVKRTPTGFLRVREDSTVNAKEVTRLAPGEELGVIEEKPGWMKIRTKDGKEGWVSSAYVEKK